MLILASKSKTRAEILHNTGVLFRAVASDIDEDEIKMQGLSVDDTVMRLAEAKALAVSTLYPEDYILGTDQVLLFEGKIFDKPDNVSMAKDHLKALRGKKHYLISALAIVRNGKVVWHDKESAELTMRVFSDDFLEYYLRVSGDDILSSVGGYQLEGLGAQLFSEVKGDFRTILGLPVNKLFAYFRKQGILLE